MEGSFVSMLESLTYRSSVLAHLAEQAFILLCISMKIM